MRAKTALVDKLRNWRRAIAAVVGLGSGLEEGWESIEDMMIVLNCVQVTKITQPVARHKTV
ncbi:hypothetical protein [Oscillatoria acuminata]|uniref:hypothetical protein n=1 Tax=Oscillatoria acuminata TaxID=118323 RepID=UPI0012EA90F1|nr:hypothetical protein [Oscillatoria acuminata]